VSITVKYVKIVSLILVCGEVQMY